MQFGEKPMPARRSKWSQVWERCRQLGPGEHFSVDFETPKEANSLQQSACHMKWCNPHDFGDIATMKRDCTVWLYRRAVKKESE